eukprot:3036208-Rhodomonas_salina.2
MSRQCKPLMVTIESSGYVRNILKCTGPVRPGLHRSTRDGVKRGQPHHRVKTAVENGLRSSLPQLTRQP